MIGRDGFASQVVLLLGSFAIAGCGYSPGLLEMGMLREVCVEIERHRLRTGAYPESLAELARQHDSDPLTDRWSRPYHYGRFDENFYLVSYGADGLPGGEGDGEDLVATAASCPVRSTRATNLE